MVHGTHMDRCSGDCALGYSGHLQSIVPFWCLIRQEILVGFDINLRNACYFFLST